MRCVAVSCTLRKETLEFPRAVDAVRHRVCYLLRPCACICEIILSVCLVDPRSLGERPALIKLKLCYLTFDFNHVFFQLRIIAVAVSPEDVCLTVVVDEHCRIYAHPAMICTFAVFLGKKRLSKGILVRAFRTVADSNAYAGTARAYVIVIFAIAFSNMGSPGIIGHIPFEISTLQRSRMLCPVHHIGS